MFSFFEVMNVSQRGPPPPDAAAASNLHLDENVIASLTPEKLSFVQYLPGVDIALRHSPNEADEEEEK